METIERVDEEFNGSSSKSVDTFNVLIKESSKWSSSVGKHKSGEFSITEIGDDTTGRVIFGRTIMSMLSLSRIDAIVVCIACGPRCKRCVKVREWCNRW